MKDKKGKEQKVCVKILSAVDCSPSDTSCDIISNIITENATRQYSCWHIYARISGAERKCCDEKIGEGVTGFKLTTFETMKSSTSCFLSLLFIFFSTPIFCDSVIWGLQVNYIAASQVPIGISASNATFGPGLGSTNFSWGCNSTHGFQGWNYWTTGGLDLNHYFEVCITNETGNAFDVSGISFDEHRTSTGVRNLEVRTSFNGFSTFNTIYNAAVPDNKNCRLHSVAFTESLNNNAEYCIRIYGYNAEGPNGWTFDNVNIFTPIALPIELIDFSAYLKNSEAAIIWQTATETNNAHFQIEHSTNGRDFQNIGQISGAGYSTETIEYEYIHKSPSLGLNYYRLKQIDYDGAFEYSKVISVTVNEEQNIEIFPNPTNGRLEIVGIESAEIQIFDRLGKIVKELNMKNQVIDISELSSGLYILSIKTENGVITKRIIKE